MPDNDVTKNSGDHGDHQQTARGVLEAVGGLSCIGTTFYLDYVLATLEENASSQDRDIKAAAFAAVALGPPWQLGSAASRAAGKTVVSHGPRDGRLRQLG
jgi:hypothetical protein